MNACPACGHILPDDARFCEVCGAPHPVLATGSNLTTVPALPATPDASATPPTAQLPTIQPPTARPCTACGGEVEDEYCMQCGHKAASLRDHWDERPASWVAGVCDRGIRHLRNEDAMALMAAPEPGSFAVLVVCDGVSSARDSDVAALTAATAARQTLAAGGPGGAHAVTGQIVERMSTWSRLLDVAAEAANNAIIEAVGKSGEDENPPSCTYVAAVVDGPLVVVGWLGDSRAYWLPDVGHPHQLSVDDSWAQELISQGASRVSAENSPGAHAITRWLGPDAETTDSQTAATFPRQAGWLLVCSDGLWNYCSAANDMAALVRRTQHAVGPDPLALAKALVTWANLQGGRDNITVTFARLEGSAEMGFDTLPDYDITACAMPPVPAAPAESEPTPGPATQELEPEPTSVDPTTAELATERGATDG